MKNNIKSVSSVSEKETAIKSERFEALKRAFEADDSACFPLACAIAYSNLRIAFDPQAKQAVELETVSDSGMDKKLMSAKAQLAKAVNQINNLTCENKGETVLTGKFFKSFDKKTGKMKVTVKSEVKERLSSDDIERMNSFILGETIDGIGLELVNEIAISLLESKRKYGKAKQFLDDEIVFKKPKKTIVTSKDEKVETVETLVKPIQLAFRAGAAFINRQRAVRNRIADTVYLDMYRDDGESIEPKELSYTLEDCVLKVSSTYESLSDVETMEKLVEKLNLTKRETQLLKWILDGMDCFAIDEETGKREKIHIENPSTELLQIKLNVSERTVYNTKVNIQKKAIEAGLSPERLKAVTEAKRIKQIDPCTKKTIAVYNSRSEASKATGIDKGNILKALSGKYNLAGGYVWKYQERNLIETEENSVRKHF